MGIMQSIFLLLERTAPMLSISLVTDSECCLPLSKICSILSFSEIMHSKADNHILTTLMVRILNTRNLSIAVKWSMDLHEMWKHSTVHNIHMDTNYMEYGDTP